MREYCNVRVWQRGGAMELPSGAPQKVKLLVTVTLISKLWRCRFRGIANVTGCKVLEVTGNH